MTLTQDIFFIWALFSAGVDASRRDTNLGRQGVAACSDCLAASPAAWAVAVPAAVRSDGLGVVIAFAAGMGRYENLCSISAYALLTSVALSQQGREVGEHANDNPNTWAEEQDAAAARAAMEQQKQKELDAQYKAALGRTKTPIAPSDPWGDVRSVKTPGTGR